MYTMSQMLSLVVGISAGLMCFMVAPVGLSGLALPRRTRYSYLALCLVAGWYSVWIGLIRSGVLDNHLHLWGMSQLLSGFAGPLLFIFTRTLLLPEHPVSRRHFALLLLALPGIGICLFTLSRPDVMLDFRQALESEGGGYLHPLLVTLMSLHTLELIVLVLFSIMYVLGQLRQPHGAAQRQRVMMAALPAGGVLLATVLSTALPLISQETSTIGWGPLAVAPTCVLAAFSMRKIEDQVLEIRAQQQSMSRYLPEKVVDGIVSGEHNFELGGERAVASVLFIDIRGFTPLSQELGPEGTVGFLNRFFTTMNDEVFEHGGIVDKFIGDAMMAVFGFTEGRDASRALACSEGMLRRLKAFNQHWVLEGHRPIRVGIGLHRGEVIHGNVGSATRMDHTVIGDAVNTAARLCELTKHHGRSLLVSGEFAEGLDQAEPARLEVIGEEVLRGREGATDLLALIEPQTQS
ncbi:MAG: hypothetical protein CMH50_01485 [Myxococcales bacterium]|nr:hypothetical protein [Myxococcales bacterium]